MANTTYFGWETPDDTDLVKDGAAAIRTLGQAIDTSLQDLEGGTTGQILSKTSNTDMDFTWITNDVGDITEVVAGTGISGGGTSGSVTITNTVATEFDAKGDLVVGTGADTFDKLSAGTNDHRLVAASGETTGLKYVADTQNTVIDAAGDLLYGTAADTVGRLAIGTAGQVLKVNSGATAPEWGAAAAAAGMTFINRTTFTTSSGFNLDSIFTSTYENYKVVIQSIGSSANATINIQGRYSSNTETGSNYRYGFIGSPSDPVAGAPVYQKADNVSSFSVGKMATASSNISTFDFNFYRVNGSNNLFLNGTYYSRNDSVGFAGGGFIESARTYDGLRITPSAGTLTGQITIYGLASA